MSSATCNHTPRLNAILCRWHCCSLSPAVLSSIHHCLFVPIPVFVLRDMPTVITIRGMRPNRCKAAWYESVRHVISPPGMKHKARYSSWKAKTPPIPVLLMFPASGDKQGTLCYYTTVLRVRIPAPAPQTTSTRLLRFRSNMLVSQPRPSTQ